MTAPSRFLIEPLEPRQLLSASPAALLFDPPTPTTLQAAQAAARLNNNHRPHRPKPAATTQPVSPAPTTPVSAAPATPAPTSPVPTPVPVAPATIIPPPIIPVDPSIPIAITGGPIAAPAPTAPFIVPGSGFTAPTPQPAAIGAGFGAKDLAIARFDVVPYQTFTGTFDIGVVAFHSNGIAKVSFSANGGPWTDVTQMSLDPQTGVTEYTAALNAANFPDGQLQVRAIAYPIQGTPRVLDPLFLNADSNHSLPTLSEFVSPTGSDTTGNGTQANPYATLVKAAYAIQLASPTHTADNGTVYLEPGSYNYGTSIWTLNSTNSSGWLTITPAPGVTSSAVSIVSYTPGGMNVKLVHLLGLTIAPTVDNTVLVGGGNISPQLWLDNCILTGHGRLSAATWTNGYAHMYATGDIVSQANSGLTGFDIQRNVTVHDIGSDSFTDTLLLINSTSYNVNSTGTTNHADVLQYYGVSNNLIAYGVTATQNILGSQGFFVAPAAGQGTNIAFVNCNINNQPVPNVGVVFYIARPVTNLFVLNCNFVGPSIFSPTISATDTVLENDLFNGNAEPGAAPDNIIYR